MNEAIEILHNFREFNLNEHFKQIAIVYTGSIGLRHTIQALGARPAVINHLKSIPIGALNRDEADQLINQITKGATVQYQEDDRTYLYRKIKYLLPFFVQLMVEGIDNVTHIRDETRVSEAIIDTAFDTIVREQHHFEDWQKRLKDYFPKEQYRFLRALLSTCAHKGAVSIQQIFDLALKIGIDEDDYTDSLGVLKRDGYLKEVADSTYDFTSPFLKAYWLRRYPIFDKS